MKRVLFLFLILIGCIVEVLSNDSSKSLTFSMPHGFYEADKIEVAITGGAEGAIIRYTTDGSVPTINSPIYTKPFTLTCTTILRAVEDVGGAISKPVTSSYILSNSVLNQNNTPAGYPETWGRFLTIDGIAPADYEMDTTITKVSQTEIERSLKNLPIVSLSTEMENLFSDALDEEKGGIYVYTGAKSEEKELPGRGWERPVTLEIIGGKQHHDLIVDGCLKIHGGSSRIPEQNPKHAFRVHFKSKYGPSKLTYNLFGEKESFDALVLRTFYNFSWQHCNPPQQVWAQYTRDMWARCTLEKMGWASSRGLYVHLFLNGLYWGIYNLSERIDATFCKEHFGGNKSDYDIIKADGGDLVIENGNIESWLELLRLSEQIGNQNEDSDEAWKEMQRKALLDIDNFIDYMLLNFYCGNTDWDYHNWYAIRNKKMPGNGFKLLNWDSECIFRELDRNVVNTINEGCPTYIFYNLMKNEDFKLRFNERADYYLHDNHLLTPEGVVAVWDSLYSEISDAIYAESARWGDYRNVVHPYYKQSPKYTVDEHYMAERKRLLHEYFPYRTNVTINQLIEKGYYLVNQTLIESVKDLKLQNNEEDNKIFDVQGRLYNNELNLPLGIYIRNGRKIIINH